MQKPQWVIRTNLGYRAGVQDLGEYRTREQARVALRILRNRGLSGKVQVIRQQAR